MKKYICLIIGAILLFSCSSPISGEAEANISQAIEVADYSALDVNCNCHITLIPTDSTGIRVESHQNLIDNLKISVKKNVLHIKENREVENYELYNIFIYTRQNLNLIKLSNKTALKTAGTLKTENLNIQMKDQAKMDQTYILAKDIIVNVIDNSELSLEGSALILNVQLKDKTNVNLSDLKVNEAKFDAAGNATLKVNANKTLSGKGVDNATIIYKGDPTKSTRASDRAEIVKE